MKDILLLLCHYPFDKKNRETLSKLMSEVTDWDKMVKLINAHGIIALAAYSIKEAGLEKEIPVDAMGILEKGYMQSVIRNTWLTEHWKEVNTILCNAGIKHILLKGMALEHTIYEAKGLRQMSDNDIFIKPEESVKAWNLLQKEGFTPEPLKSPFFKKIMFEFGRHLPALYKDGYAIEIHDNLSGKRISKDDIPDDPFSDAVEIFVDSTIAFILSPDLQLHYLISHFEHHAVTGECQLRLYTDIRLLDDSSQIVFPDNFITDPIQLYKPEYRKAVYLSNLCSISPEHRLRFIIGDTFPSLEWMKARYRCTGLKALFLYPIRTGKLRWLLGGIKIKVEERSDEIPLRRE